MKDEANSTEHDAATRRDFTIKPERRQVFEAHSLESEESERISAVNQDQVDVVSYAPTPPPAPSTPSEPSVEIPVAPIDTNPQPTESSETNSSLDVVQISRSEGLTEGDIDLRGTTAAPPPIGPTQQDKMDQDKTQTEESIATPPPTSSTQDTQIDEQHILPARTGRVTRHHFGKAILPLIAVIVGSLLAFFTYKIVAGMIQQSRVNGVFSQALSNSFTTKSFTKQVVYNQANYTETAYDVSDVKKPRSSAKTFITAGGVSGFASEGYSSLDNTYVKFTTENPSEAQAKFSGKWIQVRKDGKIPLNVDPNLLELYDVRFMPFGLTSLGNFSASQRQDLVSYIDQNDVFAYKASEVKMQRSNAQNLYLYHVTSDSSKIAGLSKKIAGMVGYGQAPAAPKTKTTYKAEIWVDAVSKRIVQIQTNKGTQPVTYNFYNFDKTPVASEPAAELGWTDYSTATTEQ